MRARRDYVVLACPLLFIFMRPSSYISDIAGPDYVLYLLAGGVRAAVDFAHLLTVSDDEILLPKVEASSRGESMRPRK